ncbi:hypothetical protein [Solicola gregarius]|uniref:Uncharacterized protein n=1 Tax=Solicola gregarius TaxID=2908642 RepID=A0AA46TLJ9_9ACTN|nr:hypothetical protein [Solicola gregarius]UYM07506.1 hypothetical protein L0C25_10685 [Solicola gregarius]
MSEPDASEHVRDTGPSWNKPWTVQWHIAADGTVIRQRAKGDQSHQQLYGTHATNRTVVLADLEALDDRIARTRRVFNALVAVLIGVAVIDVVALVVGVLLAWAGIDEGAVITLPAVLLLLGLLIATGSVHGLMISRFNRAWTDAGFASTSQVTMAASEARSLIAAPGTVSGRTVRVKRA